MTLDLPYNLAFAVGVAWPLSARFMQVSRWILAIPAAVVLLYHDSSLPGLDRIRQVAPDLENFSPGYMLELLGRMISTQQMALGGAAALMLYLAGQRIRLSTLVFLGLLILPPVKEALQRASSPSAAKETPAQVCNTADGSASTALSTAALTEERLNAVLTEFYDRESQRIVRFPVPDHGTPPDFDILLLHVCSLAWRDMEPEDRNTLFRNFDIVFDNFNSAASYSGPAAIRLLRASCGQEKADRLYVAPPQQCFLFDNLASRGYQREVLLNHDGHFGNFIGNISNRSEGGLNVEPAGSLNARIGMHSFDNAPIYDDLDILKKWWQKRTDTGGQAVALYYNTISLHDGNVRIGEHAGSSMKTYPDRVRRLMSDMESFADILKQSGRPVMLVLVAEHGAAMHADNHALAGMREIPLPSITRVPLAIRFIGMPRMKPTTQLTSSKPSSYLALADLVQQMTTQPMSTARLEDILQSLPETRPVSVNETTTVMEVAGQHWIKAGTLPWKPIAEIE